jgi:hypothetical protein
MPVMRWDQFNQSHSRSYMVFADAGPKGLGFELLRRLAVAMNPQGNLAFLPEERFTRIAFEHDADAEKFAAGVGAKRTAREGGWAGQWAFANDENMHAAVEALLGTPKRAAATRPDRRSKMRRRETPF